MLGLALFSAKGDGEGWVLRSAVFAVFYPVTVPGTILLSACGLYPCGDCTDVDGEDEDDDEYFVKGIELLEPIGINPVIFTL